MNTFVTSNKSSDVSNTYFLSQLHAVARFGEPNASAVSSVSGLFHESDFFKNG
ncbi:hypothetical protein [Flectobacillus rivi]|uniref:Uncharacterized protein n=1 Tax=Flectobacillus rivi TaxID=2984209 RepID=A0ABT6Z1H5_9BACT|nr:hypothetical protein [Flectobacillus rivi]MDI9874934.1 hypothetical protein [Flectobacillus rivi]